MKKARNKGWSFLISEELIGRLETHTVLLLLEHIGKVKVLPNMGPLTTIKSHIRCRYESGEALDRRESAVSRLISGFCFDLHDDCCKLCLQVSGKHPLLHLFPSITSLRSAVYLVLESFCAAVLLVNHPFVASLHNSFVFLPPLFSVMM